MESCKEKDKTRRETGLSDKTNVRRNQVSFQDHKSEKQGEVSTSDPTDSRIKIPDLAFIFNPIRDEIKPYHMDGDTTMYTETSIARRNSLKSDSQVVESINDFMSLYQSDGLGNINKREYERMYNKMCNILRVNIEPVEYKRILEEDWKKDSKGYEKMTREMIFDSLFELCDIWCPNIDPNEYKAFFEQLKFRIRYEGQKDMTAYDILK
ncbi:hypothetical protein SteCoe_7743 [Stentor coeruleus]|uniref:EF-hand domain-containing protein n=1 Tax=Stentor coeruleus TaxID=5963 RepID=A0A1R2CLR5_9CILI|nr:hypothetical protein SteCoe_7743 [Stentor coeruleus]